MNRKITGQLPGSLLAKTFSLYKSECRHGIAYTKMEADYSQIHSEVLYYVPLGKEHEVWNVIVRNDSGKTRELTISGFAGFTNEPNYEQDLVNLQYTLFISRTYFRGNRIQQVINENEEGKIERFLGSVGQKCLLIVVTLMNLLENTVALETRQVLNLETWEISLIITVTAVGHCQQKLY